jgi:methylenetetrahydrofolate reductase (NADPH)
MLRLGKKITAGARFLVSQPVYDVERFQAWWGEVTRRGIAEKVAIVAGVHLLGEAELAEAKAKGPRSQVPAAVLAAVGSKADAGARRRAAIDLAVETVKRLSATKGLRGFSIGIDGDHDAAEEILEKSALGKS